MILKNLSAYQPFVQGPAGAIDHSAKELLSDPNLVAMALRDDPGAGDNPTQGIGRHEIDPVALETDHLGLGARPVLAGDRTDTAERCPSTRGRICIDSAWRRYLLSRSAQAAVRSGSIISGTRPLRRPPVAHCPGPR